MMFARSGAAALVSFCLAVPAFGEELPVGVDPITGYRMDNYRAPTPQTLPGGVVAEFEMVEGAVRGSGFQLIDVYTSGAVADPISGAWSNMDKRQQIPRSIWLPGVGSGALDKQQEAYFRRNLEAVSKGDKNRGLIFYCMADCWQSWNAARRAIQWGYTRVAWYPLGTDGWSEHEGMLVDIEPANFLGSGS